MAKIHGYVAASTVALVATAALLWLWMWRAPGVDVAAILKTYDPNHTYPALTIAYPLPETLFPPEIAAPTFRWKDRSAAEKWLVTVSLANDTQRISEFSDRPEWMPSSEQWTTIRQLSVQEPARVTVLGVPAAGRTILSAAHTSLRTSTDPVGAPILYREVNLPFLDASKDTSRICWRFGNIASAAPPPVVLSNLPVCANCHSFSVDAKVMGLDVDYANDKGSYAVMPVAHDMTLDRAKIFSWSDYRREDGVKTLGMLSQVSPDGRYIVSTAKDRSVFVPKGDLAFSQLFFPIKGILVIYDRATKQLRSLPGADDPNYVQSNASWSPDGKYIVFARHTVYHLQKARDGNDDDVLLQPEECLEFLDGRQTFCFDLYRVPFNDGQGGQAEPVAGASHNGMSNYFARYSPDGKWIVFCRAKTFMLLQPDSQLYIVPAAGGEARRLECNTARMNSWHSWSPNGKWLVFSSKANSAYTQLWLTHIDEQGRSTPPVVLAQFSSPGRAANIPEFVNLPVDGINQIRERFVDDQSYIRTGIARARQGEFELAIAAYQKAYEINPDNTALHENWGIGLLHLERLDEAAVHFRKAIETDPHNVNARCNLGNVLARRHEREAALQCYREALALDPRSPFAQLLLGSLLFDMQQFDEAHAHLSQAVQLDPTHTEARVNLAALLVRQGRFAEAVPHYQSLLEREPELLPALLNLASLRAACADPAVRNGPEAVRLAIKACELTHSQHAEAVDILGMAYAENGQFAEAVSAAQSALRLTQSAADEALAKAIESRVKLYEQQRPFRRSATTD